MVHFVGTAWYSIIPHLSQNIMYIFFPADLETRAFPVEGNLTFSKQRTGTLFLDHVDITMSRLSW